MNMTKWICIAVGYVFITSGIIKLIDNDFLIIFANLGIPYPEMILFLVAIVEIACGALLCARIYIRQASMLLIIIILVAIFLAKLPILSNSGFIHFLFQSRLDIILLILLFALERNYRYS